MPEKILNDEILAKLKSQALRELRDMNSTLDPLSEDHAGQIEKAIESAIESGNWKEVQNLASSASGIFSDYNPNIINRIRNRLKSVEYVHRYAKQVQDYNTAVENQKKNNKLNEKEKKLLNGEKKLNDVAVALQQRMPEAFETNEIELDEAGIPIPQEAKPTKEVKGYSPEFLDPSKDEQRMPEAFETNKIELDEAGNPIPQGPKQTKEVEGYSPEFLDPSKDERRSIETPEDTNTPETTVPPIEEAKTELQENAELADNYRDFEKDAKETMGDEPVHDDTAIMDDKHFDKIDPDSIDWGQAFIDRPLKEFEKLGNEKNIADFAAGLFEAIFVTAPLAFLEDMVTQKRKLMKENRNKAAKHREDRIDTVLKDHNLNRNTLIGVLAKDAKAWIMDTDDGLYALEKQRKGQTLTKIDKANIAKYTFFQSLPKKDDGDIDYANMTKKQKNTYKKYVKMYTQLPFWRIKVARLTGVYPHKSELLEQGRQASEQWVPGVPKDHDKIVEDIQQMAKKPPVHETQTTEQPAPTLAQSAPKTPESPKVNEQETQRKIDLTVENSGLTDGSDIRISGTLKKITTQRKVVDKNGKETWETIPSKQRSAELKKLVEEQKKKIQALAEKEAKRKRDEKNLEKVRKGTETDRNESINRRRQSNQNA